MSAMPNITNTHLFTGDHLISMRHAVDEILGYGTVGKYTTIEDIARGWNQAVSVLHEDINEIDKAFIEEALDRTYPGWARELEDQFPRMWPSYLPNITDGVEQLSTIKFHVLRSHEPVQQYLRTRPGTKQCRVILHGSLVEDRQTEMEYNTLIVPQVHAHALIVSKNQHGQIVADGRMGNGLLGPDPSYPPITVLAWNARGIGDGFDACFRQAVSAHNPSLVIIYDTRVGREHAREHITHDSGYADELFVDPRDGHGGLWVLYRRADVAVVVSTDVRRLQGLHLVVEVKQVNLASAAA